MEAELIDKLSRINEFSDELVNVLTAIVRDIQRQAWDIYLQKLVTILINFTLQPKINYMRKSPTSAIIINKTKTLEDYCLDLILQLLLKILKFKQGMVSYLTEFFMEVLETSNNQKVLFFSENVVTYLQLNEYLGIFIEIFEKNITQVIKESENPERSQFYNETLKNYFYNTTEFTSNLTKHLQTVGAQSIESLNAQANNEEEADQKLDQTQGEPVTAQLGFGTNNPGSEQSSFLLPMQNQVGNHKSLKIPTLNLPSNFNENIGTVSRSTRRADPYRSFSTNSNRVSNYGYGSNSIDYGAKDTTFHKHLNENNISILDNENSYFYEPEARVGGFQSGQEKMKHLASQLGEYCLTIDLGCLLAQKRKNQLDKVAKMAVFQDVDSIIDFRAEEKILKEKFKKKKLKGSRKAKFGKKRENYGPTNSEIKEVESSENSNYESPAEEENDREHFDFSPDESPKRSAEKGDKTETRIRKKQELKKMWKTCHVLINVIYILMRDIDKEKLQHYTPFLNLLYSILSNEVSAKFRFKERTKLAQNFAFWYDEVDEEFSKNEEICEGVDNIDKINRHFEKTLVEKHKNKQVQQPNTTFTGNNQQNQTANQASFGGQGKSFNEKTNKKTTFGQRSLTFIDPNTTNMKYYDSTVLHFSTTYDNTNSSQITNPDESIDSVDELAVNQDMMNLDFILVPENVVYFRVLDLFSVLSEQIHESITTKYLHSFETERLVSDEATDYDYQSQGTRTKDLTNYGVDVKEPSDLSTFRISFKGVNINLADEGSNKLVKKRSNHFLIKQEKKLNWILNNFDMNSQYFYEMETEQVEILENYLYQNTSKVAALEIFDSIFESLLLIKKQILDLSASYISGNLFHNTARVTSPHMTLKNQRASSFSKDLPTPTSSATIANNILKAVLKPVSSSKTPTNLDISPNKMGGDEKSRFQFPPIPAFSSSFIYKHKNLATSFFSIISQLIIKSQKTESYHLLNDIFVSNDSWSEVVKLFTTSIFNELQSLCEKYGEANDVVLENEQIDLFIQAKKILRYYTSILVMCSQVIYREKLDSHAKEPNKKKWKNAIRKILQNYIFLMRPNTGILSNFLLNNANLNSIIINTNIRNLCNYNVLRFHLFKNVCEFIKKVFSFKSRFSCFLNEDTAAFYIRFSYINFVKIYSHSSNSELNDINKKITEIGNKIRAKATQETVTDNIENEFKKASKRNDELKNYQLILSKSYMRILYAISKNRTDEIKRKFFQFRILEFFTREIDLEFDISQIRERFLRIRNETKKLLDEQPGDEESKTQEQDVKITNVTEKNTILESKKVSINMHRKKLSQHQLKTFDSLFDDSIPKAFPSEDNMFHTVDGKISKNPSLLKVQSDDNQHYIDPIKISVSPNESQSEIRSTHAVFKKRGGVPALNFHGQGSLTSSYYTGGGSAAMTPNKMNIQDNIEFLDKIVDQSHEMPSQLDFRGDNQSVVVVEALEQEYGNSSRLQDENQQNPHYNHFDAMKKIVEVPLDQEFIQNNFVGKGHPANEEEEHVEVLQGEFDPEGEYPPEGHPQFEGEFPGEGYEGEGYPPFEGDGDYQGEHGYQGEYQEGEYPQEHSQHGQSQQGQSQKGEESNRDFEESEISMRELLQTDIYQTAQASQAKKISIPSLALPSVITNKASHYGVDAKYAGSPRSSSGEDTPKQKPPEKMITKKIAIPALQLAGFTKEDLAKRKEKAQQDQQSQQQAQQQSQQQPQQQIQAQKVAEKPPLKLDLNINKIEKENMKSESKATEPTLKDDKPLIKELSIDSVPVEELLTENLFYYSERKLRKIYEDDELHVLVLSLMTSLLLTPSRGTLDEHYTSQYPVDDGKPNILYIMHFHMNHPSNQHILPLLLRSTAEISPYPAGQRLLKLLCIALSDMSIYTNKKKIGGGAYGTIFECKTNLADPQTVAIKETKFPNSIHDRCALHDIFTEITCLEHFRLDPVITDIHDYGVTESSYIIVMKKYPCSLRDWRSKQEGTWADNLSTYLTIFRDVLKAVAMLHINNITHYDIKADNILLDYKTNNYNSSKWTNDSEIRVTLGDFGECKMFVDEDDENDMRNRGTEAIKSPEMLTLAINAKRDNDNFDRRRKVGTTRASDIWSLGCLLFEILTGDFVFYDPDWVQFYVKVTNQNEILLTEEKLNMIGNNVYLVDFLRYILVRDPQHRPSIESVLKRFEHIHAILVSNATCLNNYTLNMPSLNSIPTSTSLEGALENYVELLFPTQQTIQEKITIPHKLKHPPTYMKIMDEVSLCTKTYFLTNIDKLLSNGFTHLILTNDLFEERALSRFKYLALQFLENYPAQTIPYILTPKIMDYLREVFLYRGRVLFIEDDNINVNSKPEKLVIRTSLLFSLTHFFKCSVYETWTLVNSQVLFYSIPFVHLSIMSNLMVQHNKITQFLNSPPKIQCICGCSTIILKRHFSVEKNINTKPCGCSRDAKTMDFSDCPSDGCAEYMKYIRDKFKISWDNLKWGYFNSIDFVTGPPGTGSIQDKLQIKVLSNSEGLQENTLPYPRKLKKGNNLSSTKDKWTVFQCRICQMWVYAENKTDQIYAVILNNLIKKKQNGIMIPQPQMGFKIRTPVLRNFKLSELR